MCSATERKVRDYICHKQLFSQSNARILVGISGGADSVCLLRLLHRLDYQVEAAHCNFKLRGTESDRDEFFVRQLCDTLKIPLHVTHFDTEKEATTQGESIEMAARRLRYAWFETLCCQTASQYIAIAHTKDDAAETFLLNLLRGSGIHGLCGIRPLNGLIRRPLLCLTRMEVEEYLTDLGQNFVVDSSNNDTHFRRNKIRHELLPLMAQINPSIRETLTSTIEHLTQVETIYDQVMDAARTEVFDGKHISIPALKMTPHAQAVFHEILIPYGFKSSAEESLWHSTQIGASIYSAEWRLLRDRESFILSPRTASQSLANSFPTFEIDYLNAPANCQYNDPKLVFLDADRVGVDANVTISTHTTSSEALHVRRMQKGDRFIPYGMQGSKLVSDFLTDCKVNRIDKERQLVLCKDSEILWVVGHRTAHPYRITPATRHILRIRLITQQE